MTAQDSRHMKAALAFNQVAVKDIQILPDRQRKEFDPEAMAELLDSIRCRGLINPITLRTENGERGEVTYYLVAGERRLRAIKDLWALGDVLRHSGHIYPEGFIPYTDLGELDELGREEVELDENLKRKDLTWQELAEAHNRLHNLRKQQAAKKAIEELEQREETVEPEAITAAGEAAYTSHTIADTAKEIYGRSDGGYQDTIRKELIVARHLDNPEVAKAKTIDEAFKVLKKQEEMKRNANLALAIGQTFSVGSHQCFNVDCLQWMGEKRNQEQFDCILTDPPYGMGAHRFGDGGGKLQGIDHQYDDSLEAWNLLMSKWSELSYHVCKTQAHAYVFCDIDNFHALKGFMETAGWYVFRTPFISHKLNSGRVPLPDKGPRRSWEMLLYAIKGGKTVTHIYPDVIPNQGDEQMSHGAQKPVELFTNLLMRTCRPGDKVLDSFCGTGTIFPAAHQLKVSAIGLELSQESYGISLKRLQGIGK